MGYITNPMSVEVLKAREHFGDAEVDRKIKYKSLV
jgi:hypothetical protein